MNSLGVCFAPNCCPIAYHIASFWSTFRVYFRFVQNIFFASYYVFRFDRTIVPRNILVDLYIRHPSIIHIFQLTLFKMNDRPYRLRTYTVVRLFLLFCLR
jgi:hypothetical protein